MRATFSINLLVVMIVGRDADASACQEIGSRGPEGANLSDGPARKGAGDRRAYDDFAKLFH